MFKLASKFSSSSYLLNSSPLLKQWPKFQRSQTYYPISFHSATPIFTFTSSTPPPPPLKDQKIVSTQSNVKGEEESKNNELDIIFSKINKKKEPKFDPGAQLREFEKKVRVTNMNVLKRELFNDSMQLPIKFCAYYLAGHAAVGTFLAEFCRSSIDAVNHLMLFVANYIDVTPNKQYPQGMENIKFLIVLVPSVLFLFFGGYTIFSGFTEYFGQASSSEIPDDGSLYSILLYLASFGIEISVIAYNIRDSIKMQNINNTTSQGKQSLFQIITSLVGKKDPLLQAVLYENMITLLSMSVPLLVAFSNFIIPSRLPELIGQLTIGAIQLMLGYRLGKETTQALLGQSVDEEIMKDIHEEILRNPFVKSIRDETGIMAGSVRFKYYAIVEYDYEKMTEDAMEDYKQMSEYIIYSQDYKDRQEELEDLMESFPKRLLKEIKKQEEAILLSIQKKYPQCDYFDINMDRQQLYAFLDEEEKIKNSFHYLDRSSDDELKEETEDEKKIKEWVLNTSTNMIHKSFVKINRAIPRSKDSLYYEQLQFKINPKHYFNGLHPIFIQEKHLLFENFRHQIILEDINNANPYQLEEQYQDGHSHII